MKKFIKVISVCSFFLSLVSIVLFQIIPDLPERHNEYCYLYDAMIVMFACNDPVTAFILNFFHPLLSGVTAMLAPIYLPLVLLIDLLILSGFGVCINGAARKIKGTKNATN